MSTISTPQGSRSFLSKKHGLVRRQNLIDFELAQSTLAEAAKVSWEVGFCV